MLIPNESLETPHFKLNRLRMDELSEAQRLSYSLAEDFEEQFEAQPTATIRGNRNDSGFERGTGGQGGCSGDSSANTVGASDQARSQFQLFPLAMGQSVRPIGRGQGRSRTSRQTQ